MEERLDFIKNAISGEKVGAVARSSRYVVNKVLKNIKGDRLMSVIEYGPGDGVLTKELLKILDPKGKILVVELDKNFVQDLKKINDPRLIVVEGMIQDVLLDIEKYGLGGVDLVLSSIPFSLIKKEERDFVVKNTFNLLKEGGKFIVFHQYSTLMNSYLKKYSSNIKISFEIRNIFPCFIITAKKN